MLFIHVNPVSQWNLILYVQTPKVDDVCDDVMSQPSIQSSCAWKCGVVRYNRYWVEKGFNSVKGFVGGAVYRRAQTFISSFFFSVLNYSTLPKSYSHFPSPHMTIAESSPNCKWWHIYFFVSRWHTKISSCTPHMKVPAIIKEFSELNEFGYFGTYNGTNSFPFVGRSKQYIRVTGIYSADMPTQTFI